MTERKLQNSYDLRNFLISCYGSEDYVDSGALSCTV